MLTALIIGLLPGLHINPVPVNPAFYTGNVFFGPLEYFYHAINGDPKNQTNKGLTMEPCGIPLLMDYNKLLSIKKITVPLMCVISGPFKLVIIHYLEGAIQTQSVMVK